MESIEEARKRDAREQWLMLPVVVVWLVVCSGIYILLIVEEITVLGVTYYCIAKTVWFLNLVFIGGLSLILGTLSLSVLVMLGRIAKNLASKIHPWKPLLISSCLLIIGFVFFSIAFHAHEAISSNIRAINSWCYGIVGDYSAITWLIEIISILFSFFLVSFMLGLLAQAVALPFHAKNIANEIHAINK